RVILAPVQHCPGPDDLVTSAVYHRQHQILIIRGYLRAVLVAVYRRTRSRRFGVQVKASVYGHIARPGDVYSRKWCRVAKEYALRTGIGITVRICRDK